MIGALRVDGTVDEATLGALIEAARPLECAARRVDGVGAERIAGVGAHVCVGIFDCCSHLNCNCVCALAHVHSQSEFLMRSIALRGQHHISSRHRRRR